MVFGSCLGLESGRHTLEEIREALRSDKKLLAVMDDKQKMQEFCDNYFDEKEEEAKEKVRPVSTKSMALVASKTHDPLQAQVCFHLAYCLSFLLTVSSSATMLSYPQVQTPSASSRVTTLRKKRRRDFLGQALEMTLSAKCLG